jgi:hypothetical protein
MSKVEQQLMDYKLEISEEWMKLQTHKWDKPKWIKFPRAALDDLRWFGLSNDAKATWVSILLIASENAGRLPEPPILFRRLQTLGNLFQAGKFDRVIHELNQCGFLKKPDQSYRVTELQRRKRKRSFLILWIAVEKRLRYRSPNKRIWLSELRG